MNVLLAYSSAQGSTAEIADYMAGIIRQAGHQATAAAVSDIPRVTDYDAVLLGSAIHAGMPLSDMSLFARRHRQSLLQCSLYLWVTCIRVIEEGGFEWVMKNYIPPTMREDLGVRMTTAFAGKLDLNGVDLRERWAFAVRYDGENPAQKLTGDYRDWNDIKQWTYRVIEDLESQH